MTKYPKGWNNTLEIDRRRRLVADLAVRQFDHTMTLEEIAAFLAAGKTRLTSSGDVEVDPESRSVNHLGEPWHKATIKRDLDWVREQWQADAVRSTVSHKQEILAQYQKLLEIHWARGEHAAVAATLTSIRSLVGTDSDRVAVYELLREQMDVAVKRLRAKFGTNPALLAEIYAALSGKDTTDSPRRLN